MYRDDAIHIELERWPEGGPEMKFRLIYDGELPPKARAGSDLKQRIRQQFHPQLRALWREHPEIRHLSAPIPSRGGEVIVNTIADEYERWGFRCVPLVRLANLMACRLNILMLMRHEPRILSAHGPGDLDNRVKTLLDGLRLPSKKDEFGTNASTGPSSDENPFYFLLEDDKMIYDLSVATDRLLAPCRPDQQFRDVVAVIRVHVTTVGGHDFAYNSAGFGLMKQEP